MCCKSVWKVAIRLLSGCWFILRGCYEVSRVFWEVPMQLVSGCQGILRGFYVVARWSLVWGIAMWLLGCSVRLLYGC